MQVNMTIEGKPQIATQVVYTMSLKLKSDYLLTQVGQVVGSSSGSEEEAGA